MADNSKKLKTSREIYNQIRWDPRLDPHAYAVVYEERFSGMREIPLLEFVPDGDIPWHRVWAIRRGDETVWDREARVDLISGGRPAARDDARAPELRAGDQVTFEARQPRRFDARSGAWSPSAEAAQAAPGAPGLVTVVTYNVLAEQLAPQLPTAVRWQALLETLRQADADIIGLQEVTARFLEQLLREPWVRERYAVSELPGGPDIDNHGQVLLSRLPVRALSCAAYSRHKRLLVATLDLGGLPLEVAVVHLSSSRANTAAARRARQIRVLLDHMAQRPGDALVLGDFNCADDELEAFGQEGWVDAWGALRPDDPGFTYDPVRNALAGWTSQSGIPRRYDRVLVRSPEARLSAVSARRVGEEALAGQAWVGGELFASDHAGVSVALRDALLIPAQMEVGPTYRSAVVLLPPEAAWPPIQAIRAEHDRSFVRWMPHINLLYGFIPDEGFAEAAALLEALLRTARPFTVELAELSAFKHRASTTVWLRPDTLPDDALVALQGELERLFPRCHEQRLRGKDGFTPHLTVASLRNGPHVEALRRGWQEAWRPVEFEAGAIALISRRGDDPFEVRHVVPLGRAGRSPQGPLARPLAEVELSDAEHDAREAAVARVRVAVEAATPGAAVHVMGSTRLGLDVRGSDLDLVVVGPAGEGRERALESLQGAVERGVGLSRGRWIGGPGGETLRCLVQGHEVDLQYAEAPPGESPEAPLSWPPDALARLDDGAQQAVNGLFEAQRLREAWGDASAMRAGTRALKGWARARDLDIKALGYLGGLSWAILAAWAHREGAAPEGDPGAWLARTFAALEGWDVTQPVGLNERVVEAWRPERRDRMVVLSSVHPYNTARHVTRSSSRVLRREWSRARVVIDAAMRGQGGWAELFEPVGAPTGLQVRLRAVADDPEVRAEVRGWLLGHTLGLILELEQRHNARLRPRGRFLPEPWDVILGVESCAEPEGLLETSRALQEELRGWSERPEGAEVVIEVVEG